MDAQRSSAGGIAAVDFSVFLRLLPITGASVAAFDVDGRQSTVWSSNQTALALESLQFDLGEGPHWHALATAEPVLVADVQHDDQPDWPLFAAAVVELPVGAVYAFPMLLGAVTVGVVDLYSISPGTLSQRDYVQAVSLSGAAAKRAVHYAVQDAKRDTEIVDAAAPALRREVHQATGVVIVQLDVTATEAFFILRAHAFSNGRSVLDVSKDVLAGVLDFSQLPD